MQESTAVKIASILGLVILEGINLMTLKLDGQLMLFYGAVIGGIAGYEIGSNTNTKRNTKINTNTNTKNN